MAGLLHLAPLPHAVSPLDARGNVAPDLRAPTGPSASASLTSLTSLTVRETPENRKTI